MENTECYFDDADDPDPLGLTVKTTGEKNPEEMTRWERKNAKKDPAPTNFHRRNGKQKPLTFIL